MKSKLKSILSAVLGATMFFSNVAFAVKEDELLRAFRSANKFAAMSLLSSNLNINVNVRDSDMGAVPLHYAAAMGWDDAVQMLLEREASVNERTKSGDTPLHIAVKKGCVGAVRLLLGKKADVNLPNNKGLTPVHTACSADPGVDGCLYNKEIVDLLLAAEGVDVIAKDLRGGTPIQYAAEFGNIYAANELLKKGVNINSATDDGSSPLHRAVLRDNVDMVRFLLDHGAQVNKANLEGSSPLHFAAYMNSLDSLKLLLDRDAGINALGPNRRTPLHFAVEQGYVGVIRELVNRGADLALRDEFGCTAADIARRSGRGDIVDFLEKAAKGRLFLAVLLCTMAARR